MDKVDVNLKKAQADIRLKPGAPLDVAKLREAVVKAGFTPTWVRFEAAGRLEEQNGRAGFKVKGSNQVIPLEETPELAQLRQKASGKEVVISAEIPDKKSVAQIKAFREP